MAAVSTGINPQSDCSMGFMNLFIPFTMASSCASLTINIKHCFRTLFPKQRILFHLGIQLFLHCQSVFCCWFDIFPRLLCGFPFGLAHCQPRVKYVHLGLFDSVPGAFPDGPCITGWSTWHSALGSFSKHSRGTGKVHGLTAGLWISLLMMTSIH